MKRNKKFRYGLGALLLIVLLLAACLAGAGYAKYRSAVVMTGTGTVNSKLCTGFTLQEYQLTRCANGTYVRQDDAQTTTETQTYTLMPGLQIPQDPFLTITGKTEVKAVLYVEISKCWAVSWQTTDDWTKLEDVTGPKGGQVYAYRGGAVLSGQEEAFDRIAVLENGFTVSAASEYGTVSIVGYLVQCGNDYTPDSAAALYQEKVAG